MELWKHQRAFLRRIKELNSFGLFWEMGTGKTRATIEALLHKQEQEKRSLRILILCPPVVITNWAREIALYTSHNIPSIELTGPLDKRATSISVLTKTGRSGACITNYEALGSTKFLDALKDWNPDVIVFDEAHKLKNPTSKRSKVCFALAKKAKYRFVLTGTPILNNGMDIFGVYRCIDLGSTFGDNFYSFRAKYFYDRNAGMPTHKHFPKWTMREEMRQDLMNRIGHYANFIEKKNCLDLPPLVKKRVDVPLSPEQLKAYIEMREAFIAFVENASKIEVSTASTAMTKALRLQQIISGHMPVGEGDEARITRFENLPRAEITKELLLELTPRSKVLVWASFREDYKVLAKICEEIGVSYVELHGGTAPGKRQEIVDSFNEDESVRVFIGNGISAGIGINLVSSDVSLYYSRSFSLEADLQSEARNYRGGSERHKCVTRIDLVTPSTIDELCWEALASKKNLSDNILELARYI